MLYGLIILLFIFTIILCISLSKVSAKLNEKTIIDAEIQRYNDKLLKDKQQYEQEIQNIVNTKEEYSVQLANLRKDIDLAHKMIDNTEIAYQKNQEMAQNAFSNYCATLDNSYSEKEKEYGLLINKLKESYNNIQSGLLKDIAKENEELDKIKASRAAAIQAQIREKEIKEHSDFYCLQISKQDKNDIDKLETVKKDLFQPRILSMLIWQTYYQKPLKTRTAEILGTTKTVTGIYKITNLRTKECYIGQAVDVAKRWTEHAKCGLGIDTPVSNKLYKAMQTYGLYNFSWELLEECPQDQLNEKEKYYIDLYESYTFGYNSNKGVSK